MGGIVAREERQHKRSRWSASSLTVTTTKNKHNENAFAHDPGDHRQRPDRMQSLLFHPPGCTVVLSSGKIHSLLRRPADEVTCNDALPTFQDLFRTCPRQPLLTLSVIGNFANNQSREVQICLRPRPRNPNRSAPHARWLLSGLPSICACGVGCSWLRPACSSSVCYVFPFTLPHGVILC